jgi:2'-5' RNA ligase
MSKPMASPRSPTGPAPGESGIARGDGGERTGRLFVALWPDDDVRAALKAWQVHLLDGVAAARPVPATDLHLTLVFIGPLPAEHLPQVIAAIDQPAPAFEFELDRPAMWRGGLVVLGTSRVPEPLRRRQVGIGRALAERGLPFDDRRFRPHVTLARRALRLAAASAAASPPAVCWRGSAHVLAMREVRGGGYHIVHRTNWGGPDSGA